MNAPWDAFRRARRTLLFFFCDGRYRATVRCPWYCVCFFSLILFECVYIRAVADYGHATRAKRVRRALLIVDSRELTEHVLKRLETKKCKHISPMITKSLKLFIENWDNNWKKDRGSKCGKKYLTFDKS